MSTQKKTSIGGQALIEGIMMRGPEVTAMAVRDPDGNMVIEKFPTKGKDRAKFYRLPFIRGIFNMVDSLSFGYKCLMRSAEIAGLEDEPVKKTKKEDVSPKETPDTVADGTQTQDVTQETVEVTVQAQAEETAEAANQAQPEAAEATNEQAQTEASEAKVENKDEKKKNSIQNTVIMAISVVLGLALAIGLFIFLPTFVVNLLSEPLPFLSDGTIWRSVFEGVLRILIFVGYMACMLFLKDIRRTFMYHGAEHKTIFCYENGLPLTVENVRKQKRCHPRCGTSFMILILLVGIIVSMFITAENPFIRVVIKLACLPIVVGIGYELIKLAGKYDNFLTRIISAPGKLLQHMTTIEPDDSMIECAIAAFKEVVPGDDSDNW